jgi:UDP-N-acetylglucosamine diphosphorylase/glucosamine-1-phosphate N-acetyltransferase
MGILTVRERWEKLLKGKAFILTEPYLQALYEMPPEGEHIVIDPSVVVTAELVKLVQSLSLGEGLFDGENLVGCRINFVSTVSFPVDFKSIVEIKKEVRNIKRLAQPFDIFNWNAEVLEQDFLWVSKGRISNNNDLETSNIVKASQIFIEEGANVNFSILNASTGPIYVGKNATIMEGSVVRGPVALCEGATLKMGSKIYGATTLGPHCVGGGEIKNSVMFSYTNKAHEGYLGDSVIGEWCNLGAGTSNSNVKNTAGQVNTWNYYENKFVEVGLKCGLVMGDYCRTSINSSINTGTVTGVCCNILTGGLTPKVIPGFTWNIWNSTRYEFDKVIKDISNWKNLKGKEFLSSEKEVLKYIFDNYKD